MIVEPRPRTWSRAKALVASVRTKSFIRAFEIEILTDIKLAGDSLDIGGGRKAQYRELITGYDTVASLNIDPALEPTILANANETFPIADNSYDTIVSFNTLEHLINDVHVVHETFRILRPHGRAHIFVPFLFPVHGSPQDFHRHTGLYWDDLLHSIGAEEVVIEPMVWSPSVSALATLGHARWAKWLARAIVLYTGLVQRRPAPRDANFAMGYFIRFTKPVA
ncbi:methyltransferase domain-containing protein [uncultured Devosia sp.]|uniref:methyltransferase domain-containing protein n=1 Tax=uncultured Devosia sp. TaxID=211434 RepID=UPI002628D7F6|nr:methyltransferase domain-containing protein [uncultured Devosia sp.]